MKINKLAAAGLALVLLSMLNSRLATAFAQGSLLPPGQPAPTMKSLDQIEPRTIVNSANTPGDSLNFYIISQPGSYYLTTNLTGVTNKNGIEITANNVTLDLNGFSLMGVAGSESGIFSVATITNVTVRNGSITGWGYMGVYFESAETGTVLERLNVSGNTSLGITLNSGGVIRHCLCQNNGSYGIYTSGYLMAGVVTDCVAQDNASEGIFAAYGTISGCTAVGNGEDGIYGVSSTITGCVAENNGGDGIVLSGGIATGCLSTANSSSGILIYGPGATANDNTCIGNNSGRSSNGAGISVWYARNRIENNHVTGSGSVGIYIYDSATFTSNIIVKNTVEGTVGTNYFLPNAQIVGPIITGANLSTANAWSNFSY